MLRFSLPSWLAAVGLLLCGLAGIPFFIPLLSGQVPQAQAPKEPTSYREVVKQVLPAVVSIETKTKKVAKSEHSTQPRRPMFDFQVPPEFRKFFEGFQDQPFEMPEEQSHHSFGSGFLVDANGVILTNNHVVANAEHVTVQLQDGRKFVAKDIKSDPKSDLAVLRIDAKGSLPYLTMGDSSAMEIGDRVLAVGAPFGLAGSVTQGIISAKSRNLHLNMYDDFLQTDAAINPGNSGGPLVNMDGKVVGINTAIKTQNGSFQGVGLAIASNEAKRIMPQLIKEGVVHRGYLGVQIRTLEPEVAARLGAESKAGVVVAKVFDGSPAAKAGIREGDVITTVAGKSVKEGDAVQRLVAWLPLGKPVNVTVMRDGKPLTMAVTIEEQPKDYGLAKKPSHATPKSKQGMSLDKLGMAVTDLTPETAKQFDYKNNDSGALITEVEQDSLAAEAGLHQGMLIVKVDNKPVQSAASAMEALKKGSLDKGILLQYADGSNGMGYAMLEGKNAE